MPVLECSYQTETGLKRFIVPFSKISHLTQEEVEGKVIRYLTTLSGAKLAIGEQDFDKISEIMNEQEGAKQ